MLGSGVEDDAMRLLRAFYELSGGKPNEAVPVGGPESTEAEAAAPRGGLDPMTNRCEVAVRYLLDQNFIQAADEAATYTITVLGIDRARELQDGS